MSATKLLVHDNNNPAQHLPLAGNFFVRYPICSLNLAPYAMVGGSGTWNGHGTGYGNVGAGVEYRFTDNIGVFVDGRYLLRWHWQRCSTSAAVSVSPSNPGKTDKLSKKAGLLSSPAFFLFSGKSGWLCSRRARLQSSV